MNYTLPETLFYLILGIAMIGFMVAAIGAQYGYL